MLSKSELKTASRILKVNHAGEYGAIRIYSAQLFFSRIFHKELTAFLAETLSHEKEHCNKFLQMMPQYRSRPCRMMWLWGCGGWMLGIITAMFGKNAIMACTVAVEKTVHRHLDAQIRYLDGKDLVLKELIQNIQKEEIRHLEYAQKRIDNNLVSKILLRIVSLATEVVIWLSTQGAVTKMQKALS